MPYPGFQYGVQKDKKGVPQYQPPTPLEESYRIQLRGLVGPGGGYQDVLDEYGTAIREPGTLAKLGITPELVRGFAGQMFRAPEKWRKAETQRRLKGYSRNLALVGNKALAGVMGAGGAGSSGAQFGAERFADIAARGASDIRAQVGQEARQRRLENMGIGLGALGTYQTAAEGERTSAINRLKDELAMKLQAGQITKDDLYKLLGLERGERQYGLEYLKDIFGIEKGVPKQGSSILDVLGMLGSALILK